MSQDPIIEAFERLIGQLGSEKSKAAYRVDWTRFVVWLKTQKETDGLSVLDVKPRHVEDHLQWLQVERKCERSTCGRALSVIREVYGKLVRDELMEVNPAREVKNKKFDSTPNTPYLNEEQVQQLLHLPTNTWLERRADLCVSLLLCLGWRREEIVALLVEDFEGSVVSSTTIKGGKRLKVAVPPQLQLRIEMWKKTEGLKFGPLLFRAPNDRRAITGNILYNIVVERTAKVGKEVSPHGLRRSYITILRQRGVSLKALQLSVGHSSTAVTERYDKDLDATKFAPAEKIFDLFGEEK